MLKLTNIYSLLFTVSQILSTWIPFLSIELRFLIYWPSREENNNCYPACFKKFPNTISIIDCTEGGLEKPSLAKAQAQTYSSTNQKILGRSYYQ